MAIVDNLKFNNDGLIPAIAQDAETGEVLMQAYMNRESLQLTLDTGFAHYFSRSRQSLWKKGETSGNVQRVVSIWTDCDNDCILLKVRQTGVACHTGERSCFFKNIVTNENVASASFLYKLYDTIKNRKLNPIEGSYTNYLFDKGIDKILKKVGEECSEVIIASKNSGTDELQYEEADLIYHLLVLMNEKGLTLESLFAELENRVK